MDGVLDARFDHLPAVPEKLSAPLPWVKFTVACFRFSEVMTHFEDEGYSVKPMLVVRDVRSVFNSLIQKKYGRNGITADDPPLRLRLRRFLEDWRMFREKNWPVVKYEDFTKDPVGHLKTSCEALGLGWDEAMVRWPKKVEQIADAGFGNETFTLSRGSSLAATVKPALANIKTDHTPPEDLEWMEREFAEMNAAMGYAAHVPATAGASLGRRAVPRFENTRRYERLRRKYRISRFLSGMGSWMKRRPTPARPSAGTQ
jgi:hypothetical protein